MLHPFHPAALLLVPALSLLRLVLLFLLGAKHPFPPLVGAADGGRRKGRSGGTDRRRTAVVARSGSQGPEPIVVVAAPCLTMAQVAVEEGVLPRKQDRYITV